MWRRVGVSLVKTGPSLSKLKWLSFSSLLIKPDLSYTVEPSSASSLCPPVSSRQSILSQLRDLLCALCRCLVTLSLLTPLLLTYPVLPGKFWNRYLLWTLEALGPFYMKLGQWASTKRDMFSPELCSTLSSLQRSTTPHCWSHTFHTL